MLELTFHPLTPDRWRDLERLFGKRGAYGGCWCMYWRIARSQFDANGNEGNKRAMKRIVKRGDFTGIIAYANDEPIAWCSIAPRETYPSLERSRTLKRVDDRPVWSIVCFFVSKSHRKQGLMTKLLQAAIGFASENGARIVEGYPTRVKRELKGYEGYMGTASAFRRAGFKTVQHAGSHRIMRYDI